MKYYFLPFLLSLPLHQALAELPSNAVQSEPPKPEIKPEKPIPAQTMSPEAAELQSKIHNIESTLEGTTLEDLQKNPALAEKALNLGMLRENWGLVERVLPIYRQSPNADQLLIDYAQGALYREKGEYKKAIDIYRKLIADNPDKLRVRMDLAMLLFADHQDTAAKDQFTKLRSDPKSDDLVKKLIDQYLERINQRASWSFNAGLSYIQDGNVNNASKSKVIHFGSLVFQKEKDSLPQSAHGIDFSLGVGRDFNLVGSHYLSLDASGYGKIYWDNHPFDDLGARLGVGYQYKDARNNFAFTPFAKYRHFGDDPYSKTFGFGVSASRWLSPNWQISNYNELAFEKFLRKDERDKPSERQLFSSASVMFAPKATQYFFVTGSVFDIKAQTKAASSTRFGLSATWNQDWGFGGLSSRLNLGTGYKSYKGKSYLGKTRKDQDFSAGLTLWNRDWHAWGITPKISFRYNKVDSNLDDLYSYDKGTVFLQFDKTF